MRAEDEVPAMALLEEATARHAAIEPHGVRCGRDSIVTQLSAVTVHVPKVDATAASRRITRMLSAAKNRRLLPRAQLTKATIRDADWNTSWKKHYTPTHIAPGLFIAPTWRRRFRRPRKANVLWLDPGMAFGTGKHATTQLALNLLLPYVKPKSVVLDIGCGSGILALAAAQKGARVYASDIDSLAIAATRENFVFNKLRLASLMQAPGVPNAFPKADVIVANLTAPVILLLARVLARKLVAGGILVTSGIIQSAAAGVGKELERQGLELLEAARRAEIGRIDDKAVITGIWRAFVHRKRQAK